MSLTLIALNINSYNGKLHVHDKSQNKAFVKLIMRTRIVSNVYGKLLTLNVSVI